MATNLNSALSEQDFENICKEYDEIGEKITDWLQRAKYLKNCDQQAHLDCLTHAKLCQDRRNELAPYVIAWQKKKPKSRLSLTTLRTFAAEGFAELLLTVTTTYLSVKVTMGTEGTLGQESFPTLVGVVMLNM